MEHLAKHDLVAEECHGFLPGRGTITAVLELLEKLQGGIEDGEVTTLLGCDISGAFDVLDRKKLLRTLSRTGFKGKSYKLIENYFEERKETVEVGIARSEEKESDTGVLQGSGLSPVFFLLYFLRSCFAIRKCEWCGRQLQLKNKEREGDCHKCGASCVYADDLNAVGFEDKFDIESLKNKIKTQGDRIEGTLQRQLLMMNTEKTQFIVCCDN